MQKLRVKRIKLRIEMDKTQGQISENSGSKLKNSGFGISPNLVKFSRTAQKKSLRNGTFTSKFLGVRMMLGYVKQCWTVLHPPLLFVNKALRI